MKEQSSPFIDKSLISPASELECGCDEAGRGPLAGPLMASSVILPPDFYHPLLRDSKKLSKKQRDFLRKIIEKEALDYAIAVVDVQIIDQINVFNASMYAMELSIKKLKINPKKILIDGKHFKGFLDIPFCCHIKGDGRFMSIAAASILAKTYRDEYMETLSKEFPSYRWDQNKGYPTSFHREALKKYGISPHHRKSFRLIYP